MARPTASACTSTAIGRSPSQVIVSTLPEAPSDAASSMPAARCGDVAHAVALHGEQAHLAGRAEAVLDAPEHAVLAEPLALEIQDDVDHVLERARPGDRTLLGDVPDQEHGDPGRLGDLAHAQHRGANLRDAAGRAGGRGVAKRLHGIDHRPATGAPPRWWRSRCRRRIRRAGEPWHRCIQAAELAGQAAQATPHRCSTAPVTPRRRSCATPAARWWTSRCQGHHRAARRCRERSPLPGRGRLRTNRWPGSCAGAAITASIGVVVAAAVSAAAFARSGAPRPRSGCSRPRTRGTAPATSAPRPRTRSRRSAGEARRVASRWPWATHPTEQMYALSSECVRV